MQASVAQKKRGGCLLRLARGAVICLLAAVVAAAVGTVFWRTGRPQGWLVSDGLERVLGARAEVTGISLAPTAQIAGLTLYDTPSEKMERPLLRLQGLELDYTLWPADQRYLTRLALNRVSLSIDGRDPEDPNYDFLLRFLNAPSSGTNATSSVSPSATRFSSSLLPKKVVVGAFDVAADMPSWSARVEGMSAAGTVDALDALECRMRGAPVRVSWSATGVSTDVESLEGNADFLLTRRGETVRIEGHAGLPGLAAVDVAAELAQTPPTLQAKVDLREVTLQGELWGAVAQDLFSVPLRFDTVRITDSLIDLVWRDGALDTASARLDAQIDGTVFGPVETPYYRGALHVLSDGGLDGATPLALSATLNEGQALRAVLQGTPAQLTADLTLAGWTRAQVMGATPAAYQSILEAVPRLDGLSASLQAEWSRPTYRVTGRITPMLAGAGPVEWAVTAHGGLEDPPLCQGSGETSWRQGAVKVQWNIDSASAFSAQATLSGVSPRDWLEGWLGLTAFSEMGGKANGTVAVTGVPDTPTQVRLDLAAEGLAYGKFSIPTEVPVVLKGEAALAADGSGLNGKTLTLTAGEPVQMALQGWRASFDPVQVKGKIQGTVDLGVLGGWCGLTELQGEAAFTGKLSAGKDALDVASLDVTADTLGYGELTTPYRMPVTAKADVHLAYDGLRMSADTVALTLGADTRATATGVSLAPLAGEDAPWVHVAGLSVETGLAPLVSKGYLDQATGTASLKGTDLSFGAQGFKGSADYSVAAAILVLPSAVAALLGVKAEGHFDYDGGLQDSGSLATEKAIAGGAAIHGLSAEVHGDGETLRLTQVQGNLFGGRLKAEVAVSVFQPGFPLHVSALLENADLAVFTNEYHPPSVRLTGRVRGTASLSYDADGIEDLAVDLETVDGLTVNRDFVEEILLSQYVGSVTGGKTLSKAVQKTIGKEADRPFDSARIVLGYEKGRITGSAVLKSRLLDLTVDIKADPETLTDAIMLRQTERVQFETVDNGAQK